jgi:hypothetical protein
LFLFHFDVSDRTTQLTYDLSYNPVEEMATTTAGEQSVLAVCLFIKQWYCIQQANEQKYRRNRQSVVQALVPAMFQLFQLSTYLSKKYLR